MPVMTKVKYHLQLQKRNVKIELGLAERVNIKSLSLGRKKRPPSFWTKESLLERKANIKRKKEKKNKPKTVGKPKSSGYSDY